MTIQEYRDLLNELVSLTVRKSRPIPKRKLNVGRIAEVMAALDTFQATMPCYRVVCVRECYVGQGVTWMPGDVYEKTWDPDTANAIVKMFDEDPWVGPGAWEIQTITPVTLDK